MKLQLMSISEIKPYPNNPRKNDVAVDMVVESIKQCGYIAPIIVDENNVILAGHTRYKALKKMGKKKVNVLIKDGLSEEQKKKYRILDNKTNEFAEWDKDILNDELAEIDFGDFDFGFDDMSELDFSDFDENNGLDAEKEIKNNVIVSINCDNVDKYKLIKSELQTVANKINATVSVKMS